MYTSYIGKKFLKLYNEREGKNLSAEEFFEKEFYPLFFKEEKHLLHVGNSPFFQKPKEEDVKKYGSKSLAQYNNLKEAIEYDIPNMSIFVGSAAKDVGGTTSGQVSNINFVADKDEMYASWMGEALGIGVQGRLIFLIDEPYILWTLFQGWSFYRKFITQTPNVKDKEIEMWNAHWIEHCFKNYFDERNPLDGLFIDTETSMGETRIKKKIWSGIMFSLAQKFPNEVFTIYTYQLDKTNTTIGFTNVYLPEVRRFYEIRDVLFLDKNKTLLSDEDITTISTFYNFRDACKLGTIGLKAIEPYELRAYMPRGSVLYAQGKEYKFTNEESFRQYQLYKIWIIAMLNKTELLKLASDVANALSEFEKPKQDDRGKKVFSTLSQEVRESSNLRLFIDKLTEVLNQSPTNSEVFKKVVDEVLKMPSDNFPLFVTLIRFEYAYIKTKN
jgi:hypothetical protein